MHAILISPDPRVRESDLFKSFLDMSIYLHDGDTNLKSESITPHEWMMELKQAEALLRELRSSVYNHKDRPGSSIETRRRMTDLSGQIDRLERALDSIASATAEQISRIELSRRRDQILQLKRQKDEVGRLLQPRTSVSNDTPSGSVKDRGQLLSQPSSNNPAPRSTRKFGVAQETPETLSKDNKQVLEYQTDIMKTQEESIATLGQIIKRQKEIGVAIGNELDVQNQMIDEMDDKVASAAVDVKGVHKRLDKVRKG